MTGPEEFNRLREEHQRFETMSGRIICESYQHEFGKVPWPCPMSRALDQIEEMKEALKALAIDANRLCDRNLGGTYEDDCRRAIKHAREALSLCHLVSGKGE